MMVSTMSLGMMAMVQLPQHGMMAMGQSLVQRCQPTLSTSAQTKKMKVQMGRRRRTAQRLATYHLLHRPQYHMTYKTSSRHHHKFPKVGARAASMAPDEKWPRRIAPGSAMCATRTSGMKRSTTRTSKMIISHALRKDAHSLVLSL